MFVYDRPFLLAMENPLDTTADVGRCVFWTRVFRFSPKA